MTDWAPVIVGSLTTVAVGLTTTLIHHKLNTVSRSLEARVDHVADEVRKIKAQHREEELEEEIEEARAQGWAPLKTWRSVGRRRTLRHPWGKGRTMRSRPTKKTS